MSGINTLAEPATTATGATPARPAAERDATGAVAWTVAKGLTPYPAAVAAMEARVAGIMAGMAPEQVWLVEHPPLYTGGTSAKPADLLDPERFPVFPTGRGGEYTYHGPGQRVAYVMLDLNRRGRDIRKFVTRLEDWVIDAVAEFGVVAGRRKNCVGIWVDRPEKGAGKQDKIAAIGIRVRRWITFHGIALNVAPDLGHFSGIVPCGVTSQGVTSLADLGKPATMAEADAALRRAFEANFGATFTG
jgi:lipoyl(octanoyl) transferase